MLDRLTRKLDIRELNASQVRWRQHQISISLASPQVRTVCAGRTVPNRKDFGHGPAKSGANCRRTTSFGQIQSAMTPIGTAIGLLAGVLGASMRFQFVHEALLHIAL
jgi:hypothetical protein